MLAMKSQCDKAGFMKVFKLSSIAAMTLFILGSCTGPKKSVDEENVLASLSNIQQSLEKKISYEQFVEMLSRAKIEIEVLKRNGKNSQCFMGAVDKCYAYYATGGKAWKQKLTTTNENRKLDMDLTISVLQSRAALSIQMADNCFKK